MRVHRKLINKLDLTKLENADPAAVQNDVKKVIGVILDEENVPLSGMERERVQMKCMPNPIPLPSPSTASTVHC